MRRAGRTRTVTTVQRRWRPSATSWQGVWTHEKTDELHRRLHRRLHEHTSSPPPHIFSTRDRHTSVAMALVAKELHAPCGAALLHAFSLQLLSTRIRFGRLQYWLPSKRHVDFVEKPGDATDRRLCTVNGWDRLG